MKALTLTQPWATLVAIGSKRIETRSWATTYRGRLLIHAGKGPGNLGWMQMQHLCRHVEPFKSVLTPILNDRHPGEVLPFGAIVATCELRNVARIESYEDEEWSGLVLNYGTHINYAPYEEDQERAFGDYTPGRYAWLLANVRALPTPIPAKGQLGLWEWEGSIE